MDQITPETARTALLWLRRTVENRFPGVRCAGAETLDLPFLVVEVPGYSYGDNDVIVRWDTRRQTFIVNEDHVSPADLRKATLDAVKRMMRKARRGGAALHVPRRNPPTPIKYGFHERMKGGSVAKLSGLSPKTAAHVQQGGLQDALREIRDVDDLVVQFQSRPVREVFEAPGLERKLPDVLYPMGEAVYVRYDCDKDDPVTRPRRERDPAHDPDGVQGVWKPFIHKHTMGRGLFLYNGGSAVSRRGAPKVVVWPKVVGWLGDFTGAEYRDPVTGTKTYIAGRKGWSLWCFPERASLLAIPDPRKGPVSDLLFWSGGALTVGWRGIEH